jgi:hypothetical protein
MYGGKNPEMKAIAKQLSDHGKVEFYNGFYLKYAPRNFPTLHSGRNDLKNGKIPKAAKKRQYGKKRIFLSQLGVFVLDFVIFGIVMMIFAKLGKESPETQWPASVNCHTSFDVAISFEDVQNTQNEHHLDVQVINGSDWYVLKDTDTMKTCFQTLKTCFQMQLTLHCVICLDDEGTRGYSHFSHNRKKYGCVTPVDWDPWRVL